jgi:hypothetical protein
MGKVRVKTTYSEMGNYGSTNTRTLFCVHNSTSDTMTFYNEKGEVPSMAFHEWENGNDLFDAMIRLSSPFVDGWHGKLKENVEFFTSIKEEKTV